MAPGPACSRLRSEPIHRCLYGCHVYRRVHSHSEKGNPPPPLTSHQEQSEFRCPFCLTHGRNILRLLLHLSLCHDRYQYSYLRGEQSGEHHVIIRPLNPQELSMPATTGKRAAATPPADAKRASKGTAATAPAPGTGASAASSSAASSSSGSRRPSLQDALLSASPDVGRDGMSRECVLSFFHLTNSIPPIGQLHDEG